MGERDERGEGSRRRVSRDEKGREDEWKAIAVDSEHGGIAPTISTSPPAPAISILCLLLLFSVKRAPTGETVASARGPDTDPAYLASPFRELMIFRGRGFHRRLSLSNSGREGILLLSRESASRDDLFQAARALLNSRFKLAAISSCVRHLDASMNQIRKVKRSNPSTG